MGSQLNIEILKALGRKRRSTAKRAVRHYRRAS